MSGEERPEVSRLSDAQCARVAALLSLAQPLKEAQT